VSYRVQPVDRDGTPGHASIEASAQVAAVSDARYQGDTALVAPSGVRVLASAGRVTLSWSAVAGADGYLVRRSMSQDGPGQVIARIAGVTMLVERAGPIGGQVFYRVSVLSGSVEGPASDLVTALLIPSPSAMTLPAGPPEISIPGTPTPASPVNLKSTVANGSVQMTWTAS